MAYVSVDCGGDEWIHYNEPKLDDNCTGYEDAIYVLCPWENGKSVFHHVSDIKLPKGSIEKLLGRKLTFEDGPVKI